MLKFLHHPSSPTCSSMSCPCLSCTGSPGQDTVLQVSPVLNRREVSSPLSCSKALPHSAQDIAGLFCHKGALLNHGQVALYQDLKVLLYRACFPAMAPSPPAHTAAWGYSSLDAELCISSFSSSWDSSLPCSLPVQVHLNGSKAIWCASHTSQFCIICDTVNSQAGFH